MQTARERGPMCCSLVSSTSGPKTLLGIRMHQGGPASLFVTLIWASGTSWRPTEARLDRRGILVGEMAARNDLIVLN